MKTALVVDPDLAFGFWLARGLDQAGYQGYPAKSVVDAVAMLEELRLEVSLLILDPGLSESAGLIQRMRMLNQQVRVVALIGDQERLPALGARVDLCCRRPRSLDEGKRGEWIAHVEDLLPASLLGAVLDNSALLRKCASAVMRAPHKPAATEWKQWEGRVIDRQYRLTRHLGGGASSAVFLTESGDGARAAIRLVLADPASRDALMPRWERAAGLSHPGLVRLLEMGSCESEGAGVSYLVMEYAEENLADVLRQRPLTPGETREMLDPVLDALAYLHGRGLVHGHVKPSNILAVSDRLKLSSDWLRAASEPEPAPRNHSAYDPPEAASEFLSPAADVWSLGITLVEALTQRPLVMKRQHKPPALPVTLPPLFLDIAHDCLKPDPRQRETVSHLTARLQRASDTGQEGPPLPRSLRLGHWRYAIPALVVASALSGILVRVPKAPHQVVVQKAVQAQQPVPVQQAAVVPMPRPRQIIAKPRPDVSPASLRTIQGTIEVRVRVRVDPSGSVVDATLDSAGPSRYFADRALEAARYCTFDPGAEENWMLRFDYTPDGTQVSGERLSR